MGTTRTIFHLDMDAFFAAIEQRDHPEYRGKPLMVGSLANERGVISTCSYEARKFGVHSAMPSRTAGKLCPNGIFVRPNIEKYRQESRGIMKILRDFTPDIEIVSVDEAFMDMTSVLHLHENAVAAAKKIKQKILDVHQLTSSIGIAPNKFLAKLASDLEKPNGLTVITEENKISLLAPLSINKLWGVGKVTCAQLQKFGLRTIGDIQRAGVSALRSAVGNHAEELYQLASGVDFREVETHSERKSIGSEHTFDIDTADLKLLEHTLLRQADEIASELRMKKVGARTVTLKFRYSDFTTFTRRTTMDAPTQDEKVIFDHAFQLFRNEKTGSKTIRLIGISVSHLSQPELQLDLFDPSIQKKQRLAEAVDQLRAKLGSDVIKRIISD
jgi:DNA polymerase IV